jgi:hypothetical protein
VRKPAADVAVPVALLLILSLLYLTFHSVKLALLIYLTCRSPPPAESSPSGRAICRSRSRRASGSSPYSESR